MSQFKFDDTDNDVNTDGLFFIAEQVLTLKIKVFEQSNINAQYFCNCFPHKLVL